MADAIRLPNRDVVTIETELTDAGEMEKWLFADIGGTELINLVRNDSISGINVNYSVISDLQAVDATFDPSFILLNKTKYQSEFDKYSIKLSTKIPEFDFYDYNEVPPDINLATNAYFDGQNLVIELQNMKEAEFVEVEVLAAGKIYNVRENDYQ